MSLEVQAYCVYFRSSGHGARNGLIERHGRIGRHRGNARRSRCRVLCCRARLGIR